KAVIDGENKFLENPIDVEEGVLECPRCFKNKTLSYQKQTRSADEPMTTFAKCVSCGKEWTYSG
ncbi:transcription factor S, partial [bacterium]|nr:transcription factor S [bacterium]